MGPGVSPSRRSAAEEEEDDDEDDDEDDVEDDEDGKVGGVWLQDTVNSHTTKQKKIKTK